MFAHRLLAGPSVGVAMGAEALSVTSCSILFLRCCASTLRPSGLTFHCSFNNCCGTVNICKPLLQLACLCAVLLYVFPANILLFLFFFFLSPSAEVQNTLMLILFGTSCCLSAACPCIWDFFMDQTNSQSQQIWKLMSQVQWELNCRRVHTHTHPFTKFWSILTENDSQVTQHFLLFIL